MIKKLLLILLCLPLIGFGKITYVLDDAFENYLEAIGYGNGIPLDDYVNTSNINTITYLDVSVTAPIYDLTGILLTSCSKSNPQPTLKKEE